MQIYLEGGPRHGETIAIEAKLFNSRRVVQVAWAEPEPVLPLHQMAKLAETRVYKTLQYQYTGVKRTGLYVYEYLEG